MGGAGSSHDPPVRVRLGGEELVVWHRYETLSIINDVLVGVFFVLGSIMFYSSSLHALATTLFLLGSIDLLIRPVIRLGRRMHLKRLGPGAGSAGDDAAGQDF